MSKLNQSISDRDLFDMTGVMVTVRHSRHRTGWPQLYVWRPGQRSHSVYGSLGRYAERRNDYAQFIAAHTRNRDERDAILATLDDIADGTMPVAGTVQLCTIEIEPTPLSRVRYEIRLGRWTASYVREEI